MRDVSEGDSGVIESGCERPREVGVKKNDTGAGCGRGRGRELGESAKGSRRCKFQPCGLEGDKYCYFSQGGVSGGDVSICTSGPCARKDRWGAGAFQARSLLPAPIVPARSVFLNITRDIIFLLGE